MTATLRLSSHPTRQTAALGGATFPATPTRARHDATILPSVFNSPGDIAELELPTPLLLAIPELGAFDQEELNNNPVLDELRPIPLIGALLLAKRLITRDQLDASLRLQAQTHPALPIGQILVRSGYVSQAALDRTLELQADMRTALEETFHAEILPAQPVS